MSTVASAPAPERRPPLVIVVPVVVEPAATADKSDEIVPVLSLMIVLPLPCWIWTTSTVAVSVPAFVTVLPLAAVVLPKATAGRPASMFKVAPEAVIWWVSTVAPSMACVASAVWASAPEVNARAPANPVARLSLVRPVAERGDLRDCFICKKFTVRAAPVRECTSSCRHAGHA